MRIKINEDQYNNLKHYGTGSNQNVYEVDGENYVVKKPKYGNKFIESDLKNYIKMETYPQICAKILKITPTEVWQEKIDDKSFREDFRYLLQQLQKQGYEKIDDEIDYELDNLLYSIFDENIKLKQLVVTIDKKAFALYKKLYNWSEIYAKIPESYNWDVHYKQFGYNKKGEIKIFDI